MTQKSLSELLATGDVMEFIRRQLETRETVKVHNRYLGDALALVSGGEAEIVESTDVQTILKRPEGVII
jgi:carbohydrate-selective porin OprB